MTPTSPELPLSKVILAWDVVATRWELSDAERGSLMPAGITGPICAAESWRSDVAEQRMRLLVKVDELATAVHRDPRKVGWWLRRPNPAMAGRVPLEVMAESVTWMEWLVACLEASL